jgi:hypothetical protein
MAGPDYHRSPEPVEGRLSGWRHSREAPFDGRSRPATAAQGYGDVSWQGVRPVWLSSLRSALRNIRISGPPFTVTDPPRSTQTGWAASLRTLRLCVNLFRERGLQANVAATIGCGAKHSMRIGHKAPLILHFTPDSALSEVLTPHGTYAPSASYPVSTHGKPRNSGGLHFFCNKIANGC